MKNNKTAGSDGLTKEFYENFLDELKTPLMESVNQAFYTKNWKILRRQAVINPIEKTEINVDWEKLETKFFLECRHKILSEAISNKQKTALPRPISS